MRKIVVSAFGPPEVLKEVELPDPAPGPGDLLIEVSHAGVTFVETQVRSGRPPWDGRRPALPYTPGNAVEGRVIQVGSGAPQDLLGQRVVAATGGTGGYASLAVVPAAAALPIPAGLTPGQAVAVMGDGRTALALARGADLHPGETALITAAAGGVGSLLVQLAVRAGAEKVIALVGGRGKAEQAMTLGASVAIDYLDHDWTRLLRGELGGGLQVVFDGVGGSVGRTAFELMSPRGRFCSFGMSSGSYTDASLREIVLRGVTVVGGVQLVSSSESRDLGQKALEAVAAGEFSPLIGQTFPLGEAADAHAAIEGRSTVGKTLLTSATTPSEHTTETRGSR